jgi:hypothetical protein
MDGWGKTATNGEIGDVSCMRILNWLTIRFKFGSSSSRLSPVMMDLNKIATFKD